MAEANPRVAGEEDAPNFINELVQADLAANKFRGHLRTRFPPEPNGYLHIGHCKAITVNWGAAAQAPFGQCNLRFDDTNPVKEDVEYVEAIKRDIKWLGFDWEDRLFYASDYFERFYDSAVDLMRRGLAYVDSQTLEEIRKNRGDFYKPGVDSPFRVRSTEENLDLFARMRKGEFPEGAHVVRAKIDMASPDLNLRDPLLYRIKFAHHHRTGDAWCIYPMYDWAHPLSDAFEGVTHSLCSLEFANHRPLYDWVVSQFSFDPRPEQTEFAKLFFNTIMLSKRNLQKLVQDKVVRGWDDPRLHTIAGLRRRGYTASALRRVCERVGVSRRDSMIDISLLEHTLRDDLNASSKRVLAVLRPLKVTLTNFPERETVELDAQYNSEDASWGNRKVPLTRELYIERDDFLETPVKGWFRLSPGAEVRLRYACIIRCQEVVKDDAGEIVELKCTWDPDSLGGQPKDGRKVKGTIHWVSAEHALDAEVRLYDKLFTVDDPLDLPEGQTVADVLNPQSLAVIQHAKVEPSLRGVTPEERYQFERVGYFCVDLDSRADALVFNRTIPLKDSWAKVAQKK
ncbi:MAG TPA: glutamine--tRNA ligase/YqeY domain fusion protein [Polyangiales bacterium]|nr:glutamine--tRNA ligase/YqeY domain fusion protein [Polyangiales bacterium]